MDNKCKDAVNSPPHYSQNPEGIETIQITRHLNFNMGNAIKYILRADHKGKALEDLRKAAWYLNDEIKRREGDADPNPSIWCEVCHSFHPRTTPCIDI